MEPETKTQEPKKILFSFYRSGHKVDGSISGHNLPHNTHFVIYFDDAVPVMVEAFPKEGGGYYFAWSTAGTHKYVGYIGVLNDMLLAHFEEL